MDIDAVRQDTALDPLQPGKHIFGHGDRVGALTLGDRQADRRHRLPIAVFIATDMPGAPVDQLHADHDLGDVLDINRPAIARRQNE